MPDSEEPQPATEAPEAKAEEPEAKADDDTSDDDEADGGSEAPGVEAAVTRALEEMRALKQLDASQQENAHVFTADECAQLVHENAELQEHVRELQAKTAILEEKLEQVLDVVNTDAFRALLASARTSGAGASVGATAAPAAHPHQPTGGTGAAAHEEEEQVQGSVVARALRGFVSLKKIRFQKDGFDLDLTYITDRLIAMGYPTEGVEAVYRNPMPEVQRFFEHYHPGHYRIYNLCQEPSRQYDPAKFDGRAVVYPFYDHNACNLNLFKPFCDDVDAWLAADPRNVIAVHCKAGKGRTGTFLSAYMVHAGIDATADQALDHFGAQRTLNGKGVTIPSQKRFVKHYGELVKSGFNLPTFEYGVSRIRVSTVPSFHWSGGCSPYFVVYKVNVTEQPLFDSRNHIAVKTLKRSDGSIEFDNLDVYDLLICGSVKIQFFHDTKGSKPQKMFHFWLHTALMPEEYLRLPKAEVDDACKDKDHFEDAFAVEMWFEKWDETDDPEFALTEEAQQLQMSRVRDYLETVSSHQPAGGRHRYADEEWDDDEEEFMEDRAPAAARGSSVRMAEPPAPATSGLMGAAVPASAPAAAAAPAPAPAPAPASAASTDGGGDADPAAAAADAGERRGSGGAARARTGSMRTAFKSFSSIRSMPDVLRPLGNVTEQVLKSGWLNKKGGSRRNWRKRWFKLLEFTTSEGKTCHALSYYASQTAKDPKGSIALHGTTAHRVPDIKYPDLFIVAHDVRRTYYLAPPSATEAREVDSWVNVINEVASRGDPLPDTEG